MMTIEEKWQDYLRSLYPDGVSNVQEQECRMAFYAGAMGHYEIVFKISDLSEEQAMKEMDTLSRELIAYARSKIGTKCKKAEETNSSNN